MTRRTRFAFAAATAFLAAACSGPESPKAAASPTPTLSAAPLAVHVALAEEASPEATAWARELETAVAARKGDLELVKGAAAAGLVVRITSVEKALPGGVEPPGEGEAVVMRGALVVGDATRDFNLTYRGEARPQAEALARNLRRLGDEMKKPAAPTPDGAR